MLTHELMGLWALSLSWLTALLVAWDLAIEFKRLGVLGREFRGAVEGRVLSAELARHQIEQRVRRLDGENPTLGFWDRSHESHILGGNVEIDGETLEVVASSAGEVWTSIEEKRNRSQLNQAAFDALLEQAKGKGTLRTVVTSIGRGDRVWLIGARIGRRFEAKVVAIFDPLTWVRSMRYKIVMVWIFDWVWVSTGTILALWKPHFGTVSTLGAVALIAHFLGITPVAVAVRERCRSPALAFLRGSARREPSAVANRTTSQPSKV